jgi:hypothetical protein
MHGHWLLAVVGSWLGSLLSASLVRKVAIARIACVRTVVNECKSQNNLEPLQATENPCVVRHPAWCGLTRCTADPVAIRDGYRPAPISDR